METNEKSNIVTENEFLKSIGIVSVNESNTPPDVQNPVIEKPTIENPESKNNEVVEKNDTLIDTTVSDDIVEQEEKILKRFGVKDTINSLIENDIWSDIGIKYGDKEYESIESLLSSEKPTKELFDSLSKVQKKLREDKIKEEYISIKGKDETKVKLINAILSNVDYDDLLQYNKQVVEPVKKLDFSNQNPEITENFVRQCLKDIENLPDKYINIEIEELTKDFKLIEKAEFFQDIVIKKFNDELDLRQKAEQALRESEEKERTENMKSFKKYLKEKEFSDSHIQKATQLRYSKDNDGKFHYEKLLNDKLKDKDFESKFMHFLLDEDDFLKKEKSTVKTDATKKIMELINIIPKEKGAQVTKVSENLNDADEKFLNAINIKVD